MSVDAQALGGTTVSDAGTPRLKKGQLTLPNCIALSAALMAPVMAVLLNAPAAASNSQGALPLSFLIAFIGIAFVANTVVQFSRRLPSSGLFYNYVSHGLGGGAGFYTGWLYFAAYILIVVGLFTANGAFLHGYLQTEFSANVPWWILSLLLLGLVFTFSIRSVKASVRVDLTLLVFEMLVFTILGVIAIIKGGSGNTLHYFSTSASSKGISGIGLGAIFGILSFVGFEAAATLGEETRNPRRNIPAAIFGATAIVGVFYVFQMYALSAGYRLNEPHQLVAFMNDANPFPTLAHRYAGWMTNVIDIAGVFGLFSCLLASQNATVRVIFSMGRDRVLPGPLGAVHKRFHSPYVAILVLTAMTIVIGVPLAIWLGSGTTDVYGWTGSIATVGIVLVYMLGNVALIRYFWKDPDRNFFKHVICPLIGIIALAYPVYSTAKPNQSYPYNLVFWVVIAWLILGVLAYYYLKTRAPQKLEAVGRILAEDEEELSEGRLPTEVVHASR